MKIANIMSSDVQIVSPTDTIQAAAKKMKDADVGFLPVGENDKLVGMLTDRDIALRAVANGKNPKKTMVRDVMTEKVLYCVEDDEVEAAAENMAELQIRRLPIVDANKRLVGIVSIGDIAFRCDASTAGDTLEGVCKPNGDHRPTA
jgi:CBS domain-containing protein